MWNQLVQRTATIALRMFPAGLRAWPNLAAVTLAGAFAIHCAMWGGIGLAMLVSPLTAGLHRLVGLDILLPADAAESAFVSGLGAGAAITALLVFFAALDDAIETRLAADRSAAGSPAETVPGGP